MTARRYWPLILIVAAVLALYLSGWADALTLESLRLHRTQLHDAVAAHPGLAVAAFVGAYAAVTALSVPGAAIMTLASGLLFGPWAGGAASLVGATAGATAIYFATRSAFGEPFRRRAEQHGGALKRVIDGLGRDALSYVLTVRLIPVLPFWLVNIAAGVAGVPLRAYVLGSLVGMAPATFIYSWTGAGLGRLLDDGAEPDLGLLVDPYVLGPLLGLGVLALLPVLLRLRRVRLGGGA